MRALSLLLLVAAACGNGPPLSATVLDASPLTLDPSRADGSDLTIRVRYHDADGDLGGGTAEIQDCRAAQVITRIALPAIASAQAVAAGVPIEGELDLTVAHVGVLSAPALAPACAQLGIQPLAADTAIFCVTLVDAKGTRSTASCTRPVAIAPD